jgi:hypothetical protein
MKFIAPLSIRKLHPTRTSHNNKEEEDKIDKASHLQNKEL